MQDMTRSGDPATGTGPRGPGGGASKASGRAGDAARQADPGQLADRYRDEFPILSEKTYLNSNSLGALSRRSITSRRSFERDWNELGASAWYGSDGWTGKLEEVREAFGRTVGAREGEVALMPSISAGLTAVADALDLREGDRVVVSELDFPTLTYQFLARRRLGLDVKIVESPDGVEVPLEAWREALAGGADLVATSHVFFATGAIQDVAALGDLAREAGARYLVDAYQSHGQVPLDAREIGADFLVSGALKWLMGGPGLAFLWVRHELARELEPVALSWFGVEDQFAFDPRRDEPRDDARRFELGTPAVGAAFTASGGLEIVEEIGVPAIRARNALLTEDLIRRLRGAGFELRIAPEGRRSAIVLARHPRPEAAVAHLADRGVICDARPGVVRLSPHFYNTAGDNRRAVEALAEFGDDIG